MNFATNDTNKRMTRMKDIYKESSHGNGCVSQKPGEKMVIFSCILGLLIKKSCAIRPFVLFVFACGV